MTTTTPEEVLKFWFEDTAPKLWWSAAPEFDAVIQQRFYAVLMQARAGELCAWRGAPKGRLAEIIVLDQFSRNVFRGLPEAFAQDPMALVLAQEAVSAHVHLLLSPAELGFLFLPYMHSESRAIHAHAEPLYRNFAAASNLDFELRHKTIIDRFGRYPHRNSILGRESTPEEIAFLKLPGSRF
jgi:uncharacterized protein (DUF924 family)